MSEQRVRILLQKRLQTWADSLGYPVIPENVNAEAPVGIYLRTFLLPATTEARFLEGGHTGYLGLFQVDVCTPRGQGAGQAEGVVQALRDLFPPSLVLTHTDGFEVMVLTPLSAARALVGADVFVIPTSFRYRADTTD